MTKMPTILTLLRMAGAGALLFVQPMSVAFFAVYVFCGLSDVADGYLARRWACTSRRGALLDSLADIVFVAVVLIRMLGLFTWPVWLLWWIVVIALIRLVSLLVGGVKYRRPAFLHTYMNKATGLALFAFPLLYRLAGLTVSAVLVCAVATLAAVEELVINGRSCTLDRDTPGLLAPSGLHRTVKAVQAKRKR